MHSLSQTESMFLDKEIGPPYDLVSRPHVRDLLSPVFCGRAPFHYFRVLITSIYPWQRSFPKIPVVPLSLLNP